jgi:hypothetical protein
MGKQGTHMQLGGLDLKELEAQRAELVPDRIVMRRKKRRGRKSRRPMPAPPPGFVEGCVMPFCQSV